MKIALLGDIALIGRYDRVLDSSVSARIQSVKDVVKECDYVVANLEAPFTTIVHSFMCKGVYLRSDPVNVESLRQMGVTHVSLANNHIFDYGRKGARETCRVLEEAGISYVGLGRGPVLLSKKDDRVFLEGFCCLSANALGYGSSLGKVNLLTRDSLEHFLQNSVEQNSLAIASVHFGVEGLHFPAKEHIILFRNLAEEYQYVLHGNHPHAIQGVERYNKSLLIYSQGNLCFDEAKNTSIGTVPEEKEEERKSFITILDIEKDTIINYKNVPLTDLPDGIIRYNDSVGNKLEEYSYSLSLPMDRISELRQNELREQHSEAKRKDFHFFMNRMNFRYIGAYLNGKRHAMQFEIVKQKWLRKANRSG